MALCDVLESVFGALTAIPVIGEIFAAILSVIGNVLGCV
jgi:hypothetical protein